MTTRQYTGARYVPIFGRVGDESITWDNTKPYEPLTIVLHEGNSYTSRQYVPVGIAITNEDFWALTGNYNAQIEQYHQEVQAFDNRITAAQSKADEGYADVETLKGQLGSAAYKNFTSAVDDSSDLPISSAVKARIDGAYQELDTKINTIEAKVTKRVAIIGDSYTSTESYYRVYLEAMLPDNIEVDYYGAGSVGFVRETTYGNGHNFSWLLNQALTSGKVYDEIIFYGGLNDCSTSAQNAAYSESNQWGFIEKVTIENAVRSLKSSIESSSSSNARVVVIPNEKIYNGAHGDTIPFTWFYNGMRGGANKNGWEYVESGRFWLWFVDNAYLSDGVHPTANGGKAIAQHMLTVINDGVPSIAACDYVYKSNLDCGDYTGNTNLGYKFENGRVMLTFTFSSFNHKSEVSSRNIKIPKSAIPTSMVLPTYSNLAYIPTNLNTSIGVLSIGTSYIHAENQNVVYGSYASGFEPTTAYGNFTITLEYEF